MSISGLLSAVIGLLVTILVTVIADMASEEIRSRLDHIPYALLRIARFRLPADQREPLHDQEWKSELRYILKEAKTKPISRLFVGIRYSLGLIRAARSVGRARAGHPPQIEMLRRLISITDACNILGNLFTMAARLMLAFMVGITAGVELPALVGIGGVQRHHLNSLVLTIILAVAFCALIGAPLAVLMGPVFQDFLEGHLYQEPPVLWSTPELKPDHGWIISTSRNLLHWTRGEVGDKSRGTALASLSGAGTGVGLGMFTSVTLEGMTQFILAIGITLAILVWLRIVLIEITHRWYQRQHRTITGNVAGDWSGSPGAV
jgi:hypothetical protein